MCSVLEHSVRQRIAITSKLIKYIVSYRCRSTFQKILCFVMHNETAVPGASVIIIQLPAALCRTWVSHYTSSHIIFLLCPFLICCSSECSRSQVVILFGGGGGGLNLDHVIGGGGWVLITVDYGGRGG